jgi:shikimate dehydrogenase
VSHRFAVIGLPIAHSLSPVIHQYFAQQTKLVLTYEKIKGDEHSFEQQVSDFFASGGKGLNVTLPFKQRSFILAKKVSTRCKKAGAANTLWVHDGQLWADNTDGIGLIRDLARYIDVVGKKILLLGAGGAARGIIAPLLAANPSSLVIANRTLEKAQHLREEFPQIRCIALSRIDESFDLVLNATSASIAGEVFKLPEICLLQQPLCYDLAYALNQDTPFVAYCKSRGCQALDGLGMLVEQAAESFYIWNGVMPMTEPVLNVLR